MNKFFVSLSLLVLFAAILFPIVSSSSDPRGIKGIREVVQNVEKAYGDPYARKVNDFFSALEKPSAYSTGSQGSGASAPNYQQLEVYFDMVKVVSVGGSRQAQSVADGETLTQQDNYKVMFQCNLPCYVYIAQMDSTGKLNPIFPSEYASGTNPVRASASYSVPEGKEWFYLDQNVGVETIYVMASRERRNDLEDILGHFESSNQTLVPQQQVQMNQYYTLKRGIGGVRQGGATQTVQYQDGTQGQYAATVFSSMQAEFVATRWFYHQ
jgi:hypothetical protein